MLWDAGLYADIDNGADTLNKKILLGEQAQYNFIFGEPEPSYLS
jgi:threonyl-tRNA synthetase